MSREMRMRRVSVAVLLFGTLLAAGHARTICALASPTEVASPHWRRVAVDVRDFGDGVRVLGLDGSRVAVASLNDEVEPKTEVRDGRMRLSVPWADLVDWSVYQRSPATPPSAALYFDTDDAGAPHLCRIERLGRAGENLQQWSYDADGGLIAVERFQRTGKAPWQPLSAHCFQYGPRAVLASRAVVANGTCAGASNSDIRERYVHDSAGQLLRSIAVEPRVVAGNGRYDVAVLPIVRVFDAAGQWIASYQEDASHRVYRMPFPSSERSPFLRTWVVESPAALDFRNADAGPLPVSAHWTVYAVPSTTRDVRAALDDDPQVLAEGEFVDPAGLGNEQRAAIWQALQDRNRLVVLQGMGLIFLSPTVTQAQWRGCLDPAKAMATDCP